MRRPHSGPPGGGLRVDFMRLFGKPSRQLAWLLGILGAIHLVYIFGGQPLLDAHFVLRPASVASGEVWQLFTHLFVHRSPQSLLFNLLLLWIFGSTLEREWGTKKLFVYMAITGVISAAAMVGMGLLLGGAQRLFLMGGISNVVGAMLVAFGLLWPRMPIYFLGLVPIEARWLAIGGAGFILLNGLALRAWVAVVGDLVAMGTGALLVTGLWRPRIAWGKVRLFLARRKLKALDGGLAGAGRGDRPPRYWN